MNLRTVLPLILSLFRLDVWDTANRSERFQVRVEKGAQARAEIVDDTEQVKKRYS